ncbi:hypothetical protein [Pseudomonas sp. Irchel s3a18]|uniref:hypothetical protein n=1 Tax=Pseudomonas sp. Irchel s3a18 TaxID=2009053 RepID=UPI000BA3F106|nr:hypothetical protein [Pseudomonas sp. Irchel s3a18]
MNYIIKAVVAACIIQVVAMLTMSAYVYDRSSHEARFFAAIAENNARLSATALVLEHRTEVQQQFSQEREQMKEYVDRTVNRKLSQSKHTGDK